MNLRATIFVLAAGVFLLAGPQTAAEDQPPSLSANPFDRPAWLGDARAGPAGRLTAQQGGRIDLRATLMAGKGSLANVGGKIIGIGEEVDGYVLKSIEEGAAVFSDDDEIIRISVVSEVEDEGDETD